MNKKSAERVKFIIGKNGTGKSRYISSEAIIESKNSNVVVISQTPTDKFTYTKNEAQGKEKFSYTYLGSRTVGNGMHIGALSANSALNYSKLVENGMRATAEGILSYAGMGANAYLSTRKVKGLAPVKEIKEKIITEQTLDTLKEILTHKSKPYELILEKNNIKIPFSNLSSGEQNIISIFFKILSTINENTQYYIDEPEVSLHAAWQIKIPELLIELADKNPTVKFTVATHSPIMVHEAARMGCTCCTIINGNEAELDRTNNDIEDLIYRQFETMTSESQSLRSKVSAILNIALEKANSTKKSSNPETETLVKNLREDVTKKSSSTEMHQEAEKILSTLEMAISQINNIEAVNDAPQ